MTLKKAYKTVDNIINNKTYYKARMLKNERFYNKIMKKYNAALKKLKKAAKDETLYLSSNMIEKKKVLYGYLNKSLTISDYMIGISKEKLKIVGGGGNDGN